MDFTQGRLIGQNIDDDFDQLKLTKGYDHNWVIDGYDGKLRKAAVVTDKASGGEMTVLTDLPGVQFYAGNCISHQSGKEGAEYDLRDGLCLETQFFPDAINQQGFEKPVFGPGKPYESTTVYAFKY
jgi:aldose 1-epimerase